MRSTSPEFSRLQAIAGALLFSGMGVFLFQARALDVDFAASAAGLTRLIANTFFAFLPIAALLRFTPPVTKAERISTKVALLLWAACGGATLITYNSAILEIGMGQASFLQSSQTIFIALLSPMLARQKVQGWAWLALIGSCLGLGLFQRGSAEAGASALGQLLAIASGFFAALSYLVLARLRQRASAREVTLYWCGGVAIATLLQMPFERGAWPASSEIWALLIFAGILASAGNVLYALAYQKVSAMEISLISYLTPVASLVLDAIFFGILPHFGAWLGAGLIIASSLLLPILEARKRSRMEALAP
jgi:drug/metabolite transporter (DMT)-like permease